MDHFVERRRDQAREADHVRALLLCGVEDALAGRHDAEVDDAVVVAAEHHAHDVLANVVHVALHRRQHHGACELALLGRRLASRRRVLLLLCVHEGNEVGDGALHHARALDHLRQEHLARAEEVSHHVHALHERALDHVQRAPVRQPRLLRVLDHIVRHALDERVHQPLLHRKAAPLLGLARAGAARAARLLHALRLLQQEVGDVAARQHRVLQQRQEGGRDLVVDRQLAGADDADVHASLDGVVEEDAVHGLAERLVAAEGEAQVGEAAADVRAGQRGADLARGLDEGLGVAVVLLHAGGDREDVGVEDDVERRKARLLGEEAVGARADLHLALLAHRLALLVKGHHNHGRAQPAHDARLREERLLALLEADAVHDAAALRALEPLHHHVELARVQHERKARHARLGREQQDELAHDRHRVHQALVDVDVDHLGAVLHLVAGHLERLVQLAALDQPCEPPAARDVASLANVNKVQLLLEREHLQAAQPQVRRGRRRLAHCIVQARHRVGHRLDVRRRRAAAAAHHVHQACLDELAEDGSGHVGRLVVLAEGVGETRVGVAEHVAVRNGRHLLDERPHLRGTQCAVQSNAEGLGVGDAGVECLGRLAGEGAAAGVGDGAGDEEGEVLAALLVLGLLLELVDGVEGSLGVERVEDGLHQQHVRAAVHQAPRLLLVRRHQLVERDVAECGILDGGGDGGSAVGGPESACHEAPAVGQALGYVGCLCLPAALGGQLCRAAVQLVGKLLRAVVRLRNGRRREGVRLHHVGARLQIAPVDRTDDVRAREGEDVVVALQALRVARKALALKVLGLQLELLQRGAHGAVHHHDALVEQLP
mmetsp:Transcript_22181/g.87376  ORF Transcript_22181/g.87376 Transcript_22181/m.87376 type:complete len:833 (-) Transcript_22181:42-2540(-)